MKIQKKGGVDVDTMNKLFYNFRSVGSTLRATETSRNLLEISLSHPATRFALQPDIRTRGETRPYVLQSIVPVTSAQRLRSKKRSGGYNCCRWGRAQALLRPEGILRRVIQLAAPIAQPHTRRSLACSFGRVDENSARCFNQVGFLYYECGSMCACPLPVYYLTSTTV